MKHRSLCLSALPYGIHNVVPTPRTVIQGAAPLRDLDEVEKPRFFRVISAQNARAGRFDDGLLVMATSDEDARSRWSVEGGPIQILPSDVLVEQMTKDQIHAMHIEAHYQRRWRALEDEQIAEMGRAAKGFVQDLISCDECGAELPES